MKVKFKSTFDVELVQMVGTDEMLCKAARVSTVGQGYKMIESKRRFLAFLKFIPFFSRFAYDVKLVRVSNDITDKEAAGLINFLMRNRHGTPFEHASLTFRITAPIFVWREFMRHRIGISYNEESGRYKELNPEFYVIDETRNLVQIGKVGDYRFVPGPKIYKKLTVFFHKLAYRAAWISYKTLLRVGVAKEVARMCLPVSIYSTAYVTMNPRSIMAFLSLRTQDDRATFPSKPMYEINAVADQIEDIFEEFFPITHEAYCAAGRVCP